MAKKRRSAKTGSKPQQGSQRKVVVFAALLAVMTGTSALLLAIAPAPLAPGAASSLLFAVGTPESLEAVFQTPTPVQQGRWQSVYIHHSRTDAGSAATLGESANGLADHFVIGNGAGCGDGEIQIAQRWHRQKPAGRLPGAEINASCVSICLIGDFNRARPTRSQVLRLTQLVAALQDRCGIPAANVYLLDSDAELRGIGRYFPAAELREQLLP